MPKTKTRRAATKRFKVTGAGKLLRRRRHRTTPPGHMVKRSPGSRKRGRESVQVALSDVKALKKMLGVK